MKASLAQKLSFTVFLPVVVAISMGLTIAVGELNKYDSTKTAIKDLDILNQASSLVNSIQLERGKTVGYIGSGFQGSIQSQRVQTDTAYEKFLVSLEGKNVYNDYLMNFKKHKLLLDESRTLVNDKKTDAASVITLYSSFIESIFEFYETIAKSSTIERFPIKISSVTILEQAKENSGNLRAKGIQIIQEDHKLTSDEFTQLLSLNSGITANLASKGVQVAHENQQSLKKVKESSAWNSTQQALQKILTRADTGGFELDGSKFFSEMTIVVEDIGALISSEINAEKARLRTLESELLNKVTYTISGLIASLTIVIILSYFLTKSIVTPIRNNAEDLQKSTQNLSTTSDMLASSSTELSESATEQASAVQEIASSIDEIDAMTRRNAESATQSSGKSAKTREIVLSGKEQVDELIRIMEHITTTQKEISSQIDLNNSEFKKILNVIEEISAKANIINEIVFQTKLLSFNASVEAARAGDHGKGFAVVAEEVGNLAQMSGQAAKEIGNLLSTSLKQVEEILDVSDREMRLRFENSLSKIESGNQVAVECGKSLEQILSNITAVNDSVSQIANASKEQSRGIQQINDGMAQVDQVTQQNAIVANESSKASHELLDQSTQVQNVIDNLMEIVEGKRRTAIKSKIESKDQENKEHHGKILKIGALQKTDKSQSNAPREIEKETFKIAVGGEMVPSQDDQRFDNH